MNVLSLFDGISCGQLALEKAGVKVDNYYSSEIDEFCIKVTKKNYPNTIFLGDIRNYQEWDLPKIDLVIGGSPCQSFSVMGNRKGFDDEKGKLFFYFVDCLKKFQPTYFLFENVYMLNYIREIISEKLNTYPVLIDSQLFVAQQRKRLYWTNFKIDLNKIKKKHLDSKDLREENIDDEFYLKGKYLDRIKKYGNYEGEKLNKDGFNKCMINLKILYCLTAGAYVGRYGNYIKDEKGFRRLTPIEYERAQGIPDNYTFIKDERGLVNKRYKAIGNGWTIPVIAFILSFAKKENFKKSIFEKQEFLFN